MKVDCYIYSATFFQSLIVIYKCSICIGNNNIPSITSFKRSAVTGHKSLRTCDVSVCVLSSSWPIGSSTWLTCRSAAAVQWQAVVLRFLFVKREVTCLFLNLYNIVDIPMLIWPTLNSIFTFQRCNPLCFSACCIVIWSETTSSKALIHLLLSRLYIWTD